MVHSAIAQFNRKWLTGQLTVVDAQYAEPGAGPEPAQQSWPGR